MIENTFVFVPGIGEKTERDLWRNGILTWHDLKERLAILGKAKRRIAEDYLERASAALREQDVSFFAAHLPQGEHWRIYDGFNSKTLFLDIETTGLSLYYDRITVIGTFDGRVAKVFVRGNNLEDFVDYLQHFSIVVTFNGKLFDVPFIKKEFTEVKIPPVHIDLRYFSRSLGVGGPLKEVEKKLGLQRPSELRGISGREAAVLWSRFVKGDDRALETLISYNLYDTVGLARILDWCYEKKTRKIQCEMATGPRQLHLSEPLRCQESKRDCYSALPLSLEVPTVTARSSGNGLVGVYLDNEMSIGISRSRIERNGVKIIDLVRKVNLRGHAPLSLGIDLAGSEKKPSGICVLRGVEAHMEMAETDEQIISRAREARPTIISIDSPLSYPRNRCCASDLCKCREYGITRECERILKRRGINVYPCLINSMQGLTTRGIRLARLLEDQGYEVIESYPGAAQDILGLPRKRVNLRELEIDLMNMGIKPISVEETVTHDEIDALTSALVGYFYLAGEYEAVGNTDEGYLIIPAPKN